MPTQGRYRVLVELPDRVDDNGNPVVLNEEDMVVLVSVQAIRINGGDPGSGGTTAQAFAFWEIVDFDAAAGEMEIEVMIRFAPLNWFIDGTFSLVVMAP